MTTATTSITIETAPGGVTVETSRGAGPLRVPDSRGAEREARRRRKGRKKAARGAKRLAKEQAMRAAAESRAYTVWRRQQGLAELGAHIERLHAASTAAAQETARSVNEALAKAAMVQPALRPVRRVPADEDPAPLRMGREIPAQLGWRPGVGWVTARPARWAPY